MTSQGEEERKAELSKLVCATEGLRRQRSVVLYLFSDDDKIRTRRTDRCCRVFCEPNFNCFIEPPGQGDVFAEGVA